MRQAMGGGGGMGGMPPMGGETLLLSPPVLLFSSSSSSSSFLSYFRGITANVLGDAFFVKLGSWVSGVGCRM